MFTKSKKTNTVQKDRKNVAQRWMPIKDINNKAVYRKDRYIYMALNIEPMNIDLFSDREKRRVIKSLHEIINGLKYEFNVFTIGRPVDLDRYINSLHQMSNNTDNYIRKRLLQGYIKEAAKIAASGETIERKFYIIVAQKDAKHAREELESKMKELSNNLTNMKLDNVLCGDKEISSLLFNFTHPAQSAFERIDVGPYLPPQLTY